MENLNVTPQMKSLSVSIGDNGAASYALPAPMAYRFTISQYPDAPGGHDVPAAVIAAAVEALDTLTKETQDALSDGRLSTMGRQEKLSEPQARAVNGLALLNGQLDAFASNLERRLRDHLAVDVLGPGLAQTALDDAELRRWWNGASSDDKNAVLQNAGSDAQCERAIVAVLRSPVPTITNPEVKAVQEVWAAVRNAKDPAEAQAIDGQQRGLDWARNQLATIAAIAQQLVLTYGSRSRMDVLELLMENEDQRVRDGSALFGYDRREIGHAQRVVAANAIRAKEREADAARQAGSAQLKQTLSGWRVDA